MLALLAVVVAASPAPVANDTAERVAQGTPARAPLTPRPAPPENDEADWARDEAPRGSPRPRATPAEPDDTGWARDDAPLPPPRKRPTPEEIWKEQRANAPRAEAPPPQEIEPLSARRAKRFLGALLGGAVGFAAPMALLPVADQACMGVFMACPTAAHVLIGAGGLVASIAGAAVGAALAGGDVPGAALVTGTFVGLFLALAVSAVSVAASAGRIGTGVGLALLVGGSGLVVGSQAVALLLRDDAIEERPWLGSSAGRLAGASLAFAGSLGVGFLLAALLASSVPVLAIGVGVVTALLAPVASWAAHRGLGGRGSAAVAYLGTIGAAALGFLGVGLFLASNTFSPGDDGARVRGGAATALIVGGALLGTLAVPLALEASHASVLVEEFGAKVKVSLGGGPVPGGAMGVVTARF
jgi:hypothetical protein